MSEQDILTYIPQRPPFVMIDELVACSKENVTSSFTVRDENILVENGCLTASGLVENMAQTAAAGSGKMAIDNAAAPQKGFIGALKNLEILALPKVGATLSTTISFVHEIMNAQIVQGECKVGEQVMARCELKIFLEVA